MTVSDDTRSSTVSVIVPVHASEVPLVSIDSSAIAKFNPAYQLVLSGSVNLIAKGTAAWSVNDTSVVIADRSLSAVVYSLPIGISAITLTLSVNSLAPGATLAFYLSASTGNFSSFSSVIVAVNAPPTPGLFSVSPLVGQELLDRFTLFASLWSDPDLPLQYAFGYESSSADLVMQSLTQMAYVSTILPAGQDINGFNLSCQAQVFDSYLAFSSAAFSVTVHKVVIQASALLSLGENTPYYPTPALSTSMHYPTMFVSQEYFL